MFAFYFSEKLFLKTDKVHIISEKNYKMEGSFFSSHYHVCHVDIRTGNEVKKRFPDILPTNILPAIFVKSMLWVPSQDLI